MKNIRNALCVMTFCISFLSMTSMSIQAAGPVKPAKSGGFSLIPKFPKMSLPKMSLPKMSLPKMRAPSLPKWGKSKPNAATSPRYVRSKPSMAQQVTNSTKNFFSKTQKIITSPFKKKPTVPKSTIRPMFNNRRPTVTKKKESGFAKLVGYFSPAKKKPSPKRTKSINDFLQKERPRR